MDRDVFGPPAPVPGPTVTLDQASFRALASDVRVEILKKLDERRATVTDLSNLMSLSKPTLLEHLERLQTAGLVKRMDEGRKWIYYELTGKGRKILHPERVTIVVSLCLSILLGVAGTFAILAGTSGGLGAPHTGGGQAMMSIAIDPALLAGIGAVSSALWFIALSLFFKVRGDRRRQELFATLQTL